MAVVIGGYGFGGKMDGKKTKVTVSWSESRLNWC